jgi:protein SCO1/2
MHKNYKNKLLYRSLRGIFLFAAALSVLSLLGCGSQSPSQTQTQSQNPGEKRFKLKGVVVSLDKPQKHVIINHEEIPGFMGAMTMPYPVVDDATIDRLTPGDQITADVVVTNDGVHLDNVVVVKKSDGAKPAAGTELQAPESGDTVPDFALVNQDGKHASLRDYRGKTLLITFIYTRCPLPAYCPLMSHNFAQIEKTLAHDPALYGKTHLLSISFDPQFDTPAVLRNYAHEYIADKGKQTFAHWEFAAITEAQKKDVLKFFNIFYNEEDGQITHSMRTAVISPDGKIYTWYGDSTWTPADLVADATKSVGGTKSSALQGTAGVAAKPLTGRPS